MSTQTQNILPGNQESGISPDSKAPKVSRWWIALILTLGLGLRVAAMAWGQAFCYGSQEDCLDAYRVASHFVLGETRAQYLGQPNFNEHSKLPGPLWTMLCALGLPPWGSIHGVVWTIVLLNTAAIYLAYLLAARTVGLPAALWASLLFATSPAAIEFSTVMFNPVVMPFLGGCLFLALWRVVNQEHSSAAFWLFFLPLMMLQFHMSGLMLIPAVLLVLLLMPTRISIGWLLGGAVAGAALYIPYVRGEIAHGWENTHGMLSGGHHKYSPEAFKVFTAPPGFLVNIWDARWTFHPGEYKELGRACFGSYGVLLFFNIISVVVAVSLLLGVFSPIKAALRDCWRKPRAIFARNTGTVFLALVVFVPLLISLVEGKRFHGRYCLVLLAPLFALAGLSASRLLSFPAIRRFFLPLLALTLGANALLVLSIFHYQANYIERGAVFLPTFDQLETVYQALKTHAAAGAFIQIDDRDYLKSLPKNHPTTGYLRQVFQYVEIRESQNPAHPRAGSATITFKMVATDQVKTDNQIVAYQGHGIALVTSPRL